MDRVRLWDFSKDGISIYAVRLEYNRVLMTQYYDCPQVQTCHDVARRHVSHANPQYWFVGFESIVKWFVFTQKETPCVVQRDF